MLWVRAIDDPLIDDATWVQLSSDEVLDEEEDVVENPAPAALWHNSLSSRLISIA